VLISCVYSMFKLYFDFIIRLLQKIDGFNKFFFKINSSWHTKVLSKLVYLWCFGSFKLFLLFYLFWIFYLLQFRICFKHIQTPANRSLKWYHPSLLPHHHNNNHNKIRWSAKAQPKLEMALLALFLTHHSFKILSLTHICLHLQLLTFFFSFFHFIFSF
jgi:hypothetical protein